jgi:hypothetical protein
MASIIAPTPPKTEADFGIGDTKHQAPKRGYQERDDCHSEDDG